MVFPCAYIANSDPTGYAFFQEHAPDGYLDEINWWSPRAVRPLAQALTPGTPVFFRLTRPHGALAGYGFFAGFLRLRADLAWDAFEQRNGARDRAHFYRRLGNLRGEGLALDALPDIGCHLLRDVHYWPEHRWIPWNAAEGFHPNTVQGKVERDPARLELLHDLVRADGQEIPDDLREGFVPVEGDERDRVARAVAARVGQGTFRLRLLQAYGQRCAITGEHTVPVLDAAHIQEYRGPRSNHPQNGLVLTKEFHVLFDRGYVTVERRGEAYVVRVSPRLRADWNNGRRYYAFDGRPLEACPADPALRPSLEALAWHRRHRFLGSAA